MSRFAWFMLMGVELTYCASLQHVERTIIVQRDLKLDVLPMIAAGAYEMGIDFVERIRKIIPIYGNLRTDVDALGQLREGKYGIGREAKGREKRSRKKRNPDVETLARRRRSSKFQRSSGPRAKRSSEDPSQIQPNEEVANEQSPDEENWVEPTSTVFDNNFHPDIIFPDDDDQNWLNEYRNMKRSLRGPYDGIQFASEGNEDRHHHRPMEKQIEDTSMSGYGASQDWENENSNLNANDAYDLGQIWQNKNSDSNGVGQIEDLNLRNNASLGPDSFTSSLASFKSSLASFTSSLASFTSSLASFTSSLASKVSGSASDPTSGESAQSSKASAQSSKSPASASATTSAPSSAASAPTSAASAPSSAASAPSSAASAPSSAASAPSSAASAPSSGASGPARRRKRHSPVTIIANQLVMAF